MRKSFLILVLVFISFPSIAQKQEERDIVINLVKQYDVAIGEKDSVTLKKILVEDFIGSIPNGQSFDKKSYILYHCSPSGKVREIKNEGTRGWNIKIVSNCAIVNRTVTYLAKTGGNKFVEIRVKKLEVCTKIKNKWFINSVQGTEVL